MSLKIGPVSENLSLSPKILDLIKESNVILQSTCQENLNVRKSTSQTETSLVVFCNFKKKSSEYC